jgi:hypothetical protein
VPENITVKDLGKDIYENNIIGFTNPVTKNISLDDQWLLPLNCRQRVYLFETIVHESIHRTKPRIDMTLRPVTHPDIYENAKARANEQEELINQMC